MPNDIGPVLPRLHRQSSTIRREGERHCLSEEIITYNYLYLVHVLVPHKQANKPQGPTDGIRSIQRDMRSLLYSFVSTRAPRLPNLSQLVTQILQQLCPPCFLHFSRLHLTLWIELLLYYCRFSLVSFRMFFTFPLTTGARFIMWEFNKSKRGDRRLCVLSSSSMVYSKSSAYIPQNFLGRHQQRLFCFSLVLTVIEKQRVFFLVGVAP